MLIVVFDFVQVVVVLVEGSGVAEVTEVEGEVVEEEEEIEVPHSKLGVVVEEEEAEVVVVEVIGAAEEARVE